MFYKIQYIDQLSKQAILNANKDKILIEEDNITEGNFLIFSDVKPLDNLVSESIDNQLIIMDVLATMYEDMLAKGTV